jgi:hypothetical protein
VDGDVDGNVDVMWMWIGHELRRGVETGGNLFRWRTHVKRNGFLHHVI